MTENIQEWWGYRHTNGNLQVKRYFEPIDIKEAVESPNVKEVTKPFKANGRRDALIKADKLV